MQFLINILIKIECFLIELPMFCFALYSEKTTEKCNGIFNFSQTIQNIYLDCIQTQSYNCGNKVQACFN